MSIASQTYDRLKMGVRAILDGDSLKAKVFRGGAWLGTGSFVEQSVRFGRNMLLARLLAPEAFGTMAIVMSASSVLQTLTDVGAKEALIQNPRGREDGYAGAAWWLAMGRSFSLYCLLFLTAPLISKFYGSPELTGLLRVAALAVLFEGAISSRAYVAIKEMKFRKWAAVNHGGGIAGVLITIVLSFFIRDVWALVIGYTAENAARCILSFIVCPFVPRLGWDKEAIRDLLKFSRGLFGLSLLNLIFIRTDIFVLAKLYSPTDLGLYAMAIYLVQTPTSFIVSLLNQTILPTFSHIQGDDERTNRILSQVTSVIVLAGMPVVVFLFFCGHSLLTLIYGARYGAASAALFVTSCVALLNVPNSLITMVFYAKGFPHLHRRCVAVMAILMMILTYPLARRFGLVGGQIACLISITVGYLLQVERLTKLTHLDLSKYARSFLISAAVSLSAVIVCLASRPLSFLAQPLPNIMLGIVGCLVAYGLAGVIFYRRAAGLV